GRLGRLRDALRLAGLRLEAVLGDPDRGRLAAEPLVEVVLEGRQLRQVDVREADLLLRPEAERGVRMVRPRVELQLRPHGGEQLRERARRQRLLEPGLPEHLAMPARRRLADADL